MDEELVQLRIAAAMGKFRMPEVLLAECRGKVLYDVDGDLLGFEHVHRINAKRAEECLITHNALVNAYLLIDTTISKKP